MYSCKDCALPTGNIAWNEPDGHICNECKINRQQSSITRLTSFLERIRDGRICRRCLASPGEWIIYDEDGSKHSCEREIAREALDER